MNRRLFVILGALGISGLSLPVARWFREYYVSGKDILSKPQLLSKICSSETIRAMGQDYLISHAGESRIDFLINSLTGDSSEKALPEAGQVRDRLSKTIKEDFEKGRILVLKGWIISQTEARQCALFSILD